MERSTVVTSALVLLPPESICPPIQEIRRAHDRSFVRWMPHINLIYPFVPESDALAARQQLTESCAALQPFRVVLSHFRFFQHSPKSYTLWLAPEPAQKICEVRKAATAVLPNCAGQRQERFTPHLSVGQWHASRSGVESAMAELASSWAQTSFIVDRAFVITRRGDAPFQVLYDIPFCNVCAASSAVDLGYRVALCWRNDEWKIDDGKNVPLLSTSSLRFATWNVMEDRFAPAGLGGGVRSASRVAALSVIAADVLALQEVDEKFLTSLLAAQWVRDDYFVSSVPSGSGTSFTLLLSRIPFVFRHLELGKNKVFVIARMRAFGRVLCVAAVHLTSDYANPSAEKRASQLRDVVAAVRCGEEGEAIVLGDFNFGDEEDSESASLHAKFVDAWKTARPHDAGLTFDPETNLVAAVTTRSGRRRRFDHIAILRGSALSSSEATLFATDPVALAGTQPSFLSDHFGVCCTLVEGASATAASPNSAAAPPLARQSLESVLEEINIHDAPSSDLSALRTAAIEKLRREAERMPVRFEVVGSQLLGLQSRDSDVDVLCAGQAPRATFFQQLLSSLRTSRVASRSFLVSSATVPVLRCSIDSVPFEVQYATVPETLAADVFDPRQTRPQALRKLDEASVRAVCGYVDNKILLDIAHSTPLFVPFMRCIRCWAKLKGLYSSRMGYLGGFGWTVLVARVVQQLTQQQREAGLEDLLARFFEIYADWDFDEPIALIGCSGVLHSDAPLSVLTPSKPHFNSARNSTRSALTAIRSELVSARTAARNGDWRSIFCSSSHAGVIDAGGEDARFAVVTVSAASPRLFHMWRGAIESRLVGLVVQSEHLSPNTVARLWPASLCTRPGDALHEQSCSYFLAVTCVSGPVDLQRATNAWTSSLAATTPSQASLSVRCWSREKIPSFFMSDSWWLGPAPSFDEIDRGEYEFDEEEVLDAGSAAAAPAASSSSGDDLSSSQSRKPKGAQAKLKEDDHIVKKEKMRTSADVYNRVRWDPTFNPADFTVCYEDRFLGILEVPLEEYDTENIPFHRVWMFKQRGEVVWDREKRIDRVFDTTQD